MEAIDYDKLRERVLKRYEGYRKIRARVTRLAVFTLLFLISAVLCDLYIRNNPLFGYMQHVEQSSTTYNGDVYTQPAFDFFIMYSTASAITTIIFLVGLALTILRALSILEMWFRENRIQNAISREAELEALRLNYALSRELSASKETDYIEESVTEKLKRSVTLADDGELDGNMLERAHTSKSDRIGRHAR